MAENEAEGNNRKTERWKGEIFFGNLDKERR
jgi:hypothetical protein